MKHYTLDREAVIAFREARGWNQTQFAERVGVTKSGMSKFETGAAQPNEETAHKIAAVLGVDFAAVVTGGRRDIAVAAPALRAEAS